MTDQYAPCPECGEPVEAGYAARALNPLGVCCHQCGAMFKPKKEKRGRTNQQKRSRDQERRAAKRYGGRRQAASGAMDHNKGDFYETGKQRGECKHTIRKSISLKLEDLMKIEKEAGSGETPLLEIEFQGVHPHKRYVVLPDWAYEALVKGDD